MKDFNDIHDLLNNTKQNKSAFVDYLLEYVDGDYHCLDSVARIVIDHNRGWALNYKHIFSLIVLKAIEDAISEEKSEIIEYFNSFVQDFDGELSKEKKSFPLKNNKEFANIINAISEIQDKNKVKESPKTIKVIKEAVNSRSIQAEVKDCKNEEIIRNQVGISYWGKLTVNASVGNITKLIDASEIFPIKIKSVCITNSDDTSNENVYVRLDIYKGHDDSKTEIISSTEKKLHVELHAADILLLPFKQTYVRVTANVILSIDDKGHVKHDVAWNAERFRYTRDWVDTITPSNDEPFDYTNGLGGLVGG